MILQRRTSALKGLRGEFTSDLGSIATGASLHQFRPCPLRPKSGSKLPCDMPLRVDGDALDVKYSQRLLKGVKVTDVQK